MQGFAWRARTVQSCRREFRWSAHQPGRRPLKARNGKPETDFRIEVVRDPETGVLGDIGTRLWNEYAAWDKIAPAEAARRARSNWTSAERLRGARVFRDQTFLISDSAGIDSPHPHFGRVFYTMDPGQAPTTGRCADDPQTGARVLDAVCTSWLRDQPCTRHLLPTEGYPDRRYKSSGRNIEPTSVRRAVPAGPFGPRTFPVHFEFGSDFLIHQYDDFLIDRAEAGLKAAKPKRIVVIGYAYISSGPKRF